VRVRSLYRVSGQSSPAKAIQAAAFGGGGPRLGQVRGTRVLAEYVPPTSSQTLAYLQRAPLHSPLRTSGPQPSPRRSPISSCSTPWLTASTPPSTTSGAEAPPSCTPAPLALSSRVASLSFFPFLVLCTEPTRQQLCRGPTVKRPADVIYYKINSKEKEGAGRLD
jgi:hypothetical protein